MKKLKLKIVTPEKVVLSDEVSQVSLDTVMGQITILPNHIDYTTSFDSHILSYTDIHGKKFFCHLGQVSDLPLHQTKTFPQQILRILLRPRHSRH